LWTKKEPKSLADLNGLKMRSGVLYDRLMREFGMVPVTINAPEVYTPCNRASSTVWLAGDRAAQTRLARSTKFAVDLRSIRRAMSLR